MGSKMNLHSTLSSQCGSEETVPSKSHSALDERLRRRLGVGFRLAVVGSLLHLVVGLVSMGTGTAVLVNASLDFRFPLSSGSGVWAGLVVFVCGVLGLISYSNGAVEDVFNPLRIRVIVVHYGLTIASISTSGLHLGYSVWGQLVCTSEFSACREGESWEIISTLEGVSVTLAAIMLLTSIALTVFASFFGRWAKWGRKVGVTYGDI